MINESQTEFLAAEAASREGKSQNETLRDYLLARPGVKIPLAVLATVITPTGLGAAVHSRVNDCRNKYGMKIRNVVKRKKRQTQSWYIYEPESEHSKN